MTSSRHWSSYVFLAYLILLAWLPMPLASKPLWATAFFNLCVALLSLTTLTSYWRTNNFALPPACQRAKLPLILFSLYCFWLLVHDLAGFSINPFRSRQQLYLSLSYFQLFFLTLALVDTRERLRVLLLLMVGSGVFQALYGGLMTLSGVEKIWWLDKLDHRNVATGTFTNRNQLANYLVMCLSAGCGLLISAQKGRKIGGWRQFLRLAVEWLLSGSGWLRLLLAAIVIGIVLTHSRMGNASLFFSLTVTGLLWLVRAKKSWKSAAILIGSLLVIDTMIVGTWFGLDRVVERLQTTRADNTIQWISGTDSNQPPQNTDTAAFQNLPAYTLPVAPRPVQHDNEIRDTSLPDLFKMAREHYLTGIGLGNFSTGFTQYNSIHIQQFFNEAHFDWLQFLVETGLPGITLLGSFVLCCALNGIAALLRCHSRLLQGAGFALTMTACAGLLHAWVDYNFQVPATAATFMVMLALGIIARALPDKKMPLPEHSIHATTPA